MPLLYYSHSNQGKIWFLLKWMRLAVVRLSSDEGFGSHLVDKNLSISISTTVRIIRLKAVRKIPYEINSERSRNSTQRQDRCWVEQTLQIGYLQSQNFLKSRSKVNWTRTVRMRLLEYSLRDCRVRTKPLITNIHCNKRIAWAKKTCGMDRR